MIRDAEHTPSPQSVVVPVAVLNEAAGVLDCEGYGPLSMSLLSCLSAPAPSSLAGGVSLPERLRFAETWDLDADQSARDRCGVLMLEAAEALERAALSPEAPAREGVDALRTVLIKARSELAIQYCYSAGRMGIAGCYPELAEKYGGSTVVQEIDAVLALTPRHEAPAEPVSDHYKFDDEIAWLREAARYFSARDTKGEDRAHWANVYNAENARKLADRLAELSSNPCQLEAPAEGLTMADERPAFQVINDLFAKHGLESPPWKLRDELATHLMSHRRQPEAPAEGAGEAMTEREVRQWIDACNHEPARQVLRDYLALRARSSAPEAREGEAVAWFGDKDFEPTEAMIDAGMEHCRPGNHANIIASFKAMMLQAEIDGLVSYTHPAAPSADKLRDHLEWIETVLTDPVPGYTARIATAREYIDQALAALKGDE